MTLCSKERQNMKKIDTKTMKTFTLISAIALQMVSHIALGVFLGRILDGFFKSSPVFFLISVVLFILAGFLSVYKMIMKMYDLEKK